MRREMSEKIAGECVRLRPLEKGDLENRVRWFNDPQVNKDLVIDERLDIQKTYEWFEQARKDQSRRDFIIETRQKYPIGAIGFRKIDKRKHSACFYIVIGEKAYWGKGIGTESLSLLLKWGFSTLDLYKVWSIVIPTNAASLAMLKKLDFQVEGVLREEENVLGRQVDVVRLGLLRRQFNPDAIKEGKNQARAGTKQSTDEPKKPSADFVTAVCGEIGTAITGKMIKIRPLERKDLLLKVRWINDPEVHKYLHYEVPLNIEDTERWFERIVDDDSRYDFVIETLDFEPVGLTGLIDIDYTHRTAEFYIVVGEKKYWSRGIGQEAAWLLVQWGFDELDVHKIWAITRSTNSASIALMKKMGFQIEGILREEKKVDGKRVDVFRLALLRHEFRDPSREEAV